MIREMTLEPYVVKDGVLTDSSDYVSQETVAIIPEGVTTIGRYAFIQRHYVESIQLPSTLKKIDDYAFWNRIKVESIVIPEGTISVGKRSFQACYSLKTVTIPQSVITIGEDAFDECCLEELYAPGALLSNIEGTKMKQLAVRTFLHNPDRFTDPEVAASYRKYLITQKKKWLPEVFKEDRVDLLQLFNGEGKITGKNIDDFLKPAAEANATQCIAMLLEIKNKLERTGKPQKTSKEVLEDDPFSPTNMKAKWAFQKMGDGGIELTDYKGSDTVIYIPERIGNSPVTKLGAYLFSPEKPRRKKTVSEFLDTVTKVVIPDSVTEIGDHAFYFNWGVSTITLPKRLERIGTYAFSYCRNLSELLPCEVLSNRNVIIEDSAFEDSQKLCGLDGLLIINHCLCCVRSYKVEAVSIPDGVEVIDHGAFSGCWDLKCVSIPGSVKAIGENALTRFEIKNIEIHAPAGSYAEQYAKENNIPFVAE